MQDQIKHQQEEAFKKVKNDEGLVAPSSSPTQTNMQDQIKHQQEEALKRKIKHQQEDLQKKKMMKVWKIQVLLLLLKLYMQDQMQHQQEEALKKVRNDEGLVAPSSSPTQTNMQDQIKHQQEEALKRLQELERQMVGGEQSDNAEMKERRKNRQLVADERKERLMEAIANMDDDFIMLEIYDDTQAELQAKNKVLEKEKDKIESLERDIIDIQSEFQFERIDYLDTIRKQERQLLLLEGLIDKIHPCLRRDCNYANIDRVKKECKWDEDNGRWIFPRMQINNTALPVAGNSNSVMDRRGGRVSNNTHGRPRPVTNGEVNASIYDNEEDRYAQSLYNKHDSSSDYFENKRVKKYLNNQPISRTNMSEVKHSIQKTAPMPVSNGFGKHDQMSSGLRAAAVHGQLISQENDPLVRKPTRLETLQPIGGGRKGKKKRNELQPL
ncbi:KIF17 [Mytilus edulis]|uniref:KIF17 n=1 Tax=Mytilus edulis TaxID=6550 RepID=A0A8S3SU60_MYTED|nr:KIF17 [Mytilus edulis]